MVIVLEISDVYISMEGISILLSTFDSQSTPATVFKTQMTDIIFY